MGLSAAWAVDLKSLVGLAIPAITLAAVSCLTRSWAIIRELPWGVASLSFLSATVPYYVWIEWETPGFFRYFFLNENILRFLVKNYGDRIGSGHTQLYGMSLAFAFTAFLPWSPLLVYSLWKVPPKRRDELFLLSALCAPILLFLLARQHLATYQIPTLFPASILLAHRLTSHRLRSIAIPWTAAVCLGVLLSRNITSSFYSSAPVFTLAYEEGATSVHFPEEIPLSAYWYHPKNITLDASGPDTSMTSPDEIFVLRSKHHGVFKSKFGDSCRDELAQFGKWHIYECPSRGSASWTGTQH